MLKPKNFIDIVCIISLLIILNYCFGIHLVSATGNVYHPGQINCDNDSDGYNSSICSGSDCDDNNPFIWKNVKAYVDFDYDFYGSGNPVTICIGDNLPEGFSYVPGDCNPNDPTIHPNAPELCNYVDDNCNGQIDEGFNLSSSCSVGTGECSSTGQLVCSNDSLSTVCSAIAKSSSPEVCDGKDNDCDGIIDNNISDIITGNNVGECKQLIKSCINGSMVVIQNQTFPGLEVCDGKDNDCDGQIDEGNVCNHIYVNLPKSGFYKTNNIKINLSTNIINNSKNEKILYSDSVDTKPREIILCRGCYEYGLFFNKFLKLNEGEHKLVFRAITNDSIYTSSADLFIDSKPPLAYLPRIRTKGYTNGTFYIDYTEENMNNVTLVYGDNYISKYDCPSGNKKACELDVNLSGFDGQILSYYFILIDISGNTVKTPNFTSEVDITAPIINEISYPVIGNYVFFKFNISEPHLKEISYLDKSNKVAFWKILCVVLNNGLCIKQQRFKPGEHVLTYRVIDKAGNSVYGEI